MEKYILGSIYNILQIHVHSNELKLRHYSNIKISLKNYKNSKPLSDEKINSESKYTC